ncbi:cytochrome P450 [Microthyrium microscopicum]|uniref:Cytochrome P450 n=1 Tax=Microthyrium microscopicum TaxID=703497 RepID=A0A6A6UEZ4_9PEZI|nr:cytochrome P450 [Microthyrium microscopicum]
MNFSLINLVLVALLYFPIRAILSFWANIKAARASGFKYIICPAYFYDQQWILISTMVLPLLNKILPQGWRGLWYDLIHPEWPWKENYMPFQELDADTFLLVTPRKIGLMTADPSVINQICTRRNDFPKPIEMYQGIDIYGKNVVTTEGSTWRRHRKSTVPPFGEKNNKVVWTESIFQAGEMLKHWKDLSEKQQKEQKEPKKSWASLIDELSHDTMRLSLYVISRAGFDVRCDWPGRSQDAKEGSMSATEIPTGHKMSYVTSLETLLLRLIALIILPEWFLRIAPIAYLQDASKSFIEWGKYMNDIYERKKTEIEQSKNPEDEGMDLMGAMIRTSAASLKLNTTTAPTSKPTADLGLTKDEILGNSFVLFLAGHETAANTIHFSMLYLAMRPSLQRALQADLDSIFGDREPANWDYDTDLPKLFAGHAGAVMNEELRLIPPITAIPKSTRAPQPLIVHGANFTVPADAAVALVATAVQRNPRFWPHERRDDTPSGTDLADFRPERWFNAKHGREDSPGTDAAFSALSADGLGIDSSPDTAATLFRPSRGAYIPFSEGARACLGRRFAQVEILAALAVIFRSVSVELAVDDWAGETDLISMDKDSKRGLWEKAEGEARRKMRDEMGTVITLQLRSKPIKVRICKRGDEMFGDVGK